jgi:hypothetical protein
MIPAVCWLEVKARVPISEWLRAVGRNYDFLGRYIYHKEQSKEKSLVAVPSDCQARIN